MPARMSVSVSLAALLSVLSTTPAAAAEPPPAETIEMSVAVGQALSEVLTLTDAGQLEAAHAALQALRQQPLNDYERTRILQQAINLDIMLGRHAQAILDHEALLQQTNLTDAERSNAQLMLGKLHLQEEQWSEGIESLLAVNESQQSSSMETLYLLGVGHYRSQQPALAIQYLEQAIAVGGAQAGEPHYSLLGVLQVEAKNYSGAIATYEALFDAVATPAQAESYYSTLAQLYVQAGEHGKARATLEQLLTRFPDSAKRAEYQTRLAASR
jgi:tetratricopeptide (TPR) repeat protein